MGDMCVGGSLVAAAWFWAVGAERVDWAIAGVRAAPVDATLRPRATHVDKNRHGEKRSLVCNLTILKKADVSWESGIEFKRQHSNSDERSRDRQPASKPLLSHQFSYL
jgi:hypothetical protein